MATVVPTFIQGHEKLLSAFGYWPPFHDANVVDYAWDRASDTIALRIHTWRMTERIDARGYFVLDNHTLVDFLFSGISNADLEAFDSGNILFSLSFTIPTDTPPFRVQLDSVVDMSGAFSASSGRIVAVSPCSADGQVT